MKIIDLNRQGGIGANSMYLELGPFRLVVDSGLNPKLTGHDALPLMDKIPSRHLDAILLTHCHLDHLGSLPVLARKFPSTPIITSIPSAMLAQRMMHNSVSIMTLQRDELGVKEYPLYSRADIDWLGGQLIELPYKRTRTLESKGEQLSITLHPSGHIAGAASIMLEYKHRKIFITGDMLFDGQWTIPGAAAPSGKVDTLIMETTRGASERKASRDEEIERLLTSINDCLRAGAPVLIPAFALGRMQELLSLFAHARKERRLDPAPIFCSGLGLDLIDLFDDIHRKTNLVRFSRKIVKELHVKALSGIDPHKGTLSKPAIYVVSSGMLVEKTPAYAVAASLFENPNAGIFFVGYCDEDTPGGAILKLKHGDRYLFATSDFEAQLQAKIDRFDLSGHADREELVALAKSMKPRSIVLTHGEAAARTYFIDQLGSLAKVIDPTPGQMIEV
jgi:Cft2 family RNA processing exonuclease